MKYFLLIGLLFSICLTIHAQIPNLKDSDQDGWLDEGNIKYRLFLSKIECIKPSEFGQDEIYLNVEQVRFPLSESLNHYWSMSAGTQIEPNTIIDERVYVPTVKKPNYGTRMVQPDTKPLFKTRIALREADMPIVENPRDDTFQKDVLTWGNHPNYVLLIKQSNLHYILHFKMDSIFWGDPSPFDFYGDADKDGLADYIEFNVAHQLPQMGSDYDMKVIDGYHGLADPTVKDLFIEVDAVGEVSKMPYDAKQQVVSQFYNHQIHMRIDDGYLGGGDLLPYKELVTFDEMIQKYYANQMSPSRKSYCKYALIAPNMGSMFGQGSFSGRYFETTIVTMWGSFSSITFMHELGHTLGLCHPKGKKLGKIKNNQPYPCSTCPTPAHWKGDCLNCCDPKIDRSCCQHYCGVGDEDATAMGNDVGWIDIILGGVLGLLLGSLFVFSFKHWLNRWSLISLFLLIAFLGGAIGFIYSDAGMREVNYHPNEWNALFFKFS